MKRKSHSRYVLLVDNDKLRQQAFTRKINRIGCQVKIAETATEVVNCLQDTCRRRGFELVFMNFESALEIGMVLLINVIHMHNLRIVTYGNGLEHKLMELERLRIDDCLIQPYSLENFQNVLGKWMSVTSRDAPASSKRRRSSANSTCSAASTSPASSASALAPDALPSVASTMPTSVNQIHASTPTNMPSPAYANPTASAALQNQQRLYAKSASASSTDLGLMWPTSANNTLSDKDDRLWQWEVPVMSGDSVPTITSRLLVNACGKSNVNTVPSGVPSAVSSGVSGGVSTGVSTLWQQLQTLAQQVNQLRGAQTIAPRFQDPHAGLYTPRVSSSTLPYALPTTGEMSALQRLQLRQQIEAATARVSANKAALTAATIASKHPQVRGPEQPGQLQESAHAFDGSANAPSNESLADFMRDQSVYSGGVSAVNQLPAHLRAAALASALRLRQQHALLPPHLSSHLPDTARESRQDE